MWWVAYSWPLVETSGFKMIDVYCGYPQEVAKCRYKHLPLECLQIGHWISNLQIAFVIRYLEAACFMERDGGLSLAIWNQVRFTRFWECSVICVSPLRVFKTQSAQSVAQRGTEGWLSKIYALWHSVYFSFTLCLKQAPPKALFRLTDCFDWPSERNRINRFNRNNRINPLIRFAAASSRRKIGISSLRTEWLNRVRQRRPHTLKTHGQKGNQYRG